MRPCATVRATPRTRGTQAWGPYSIPWSHFKAAPSTQNQLWVPGPAGEHRSRVSRKPCTCKGGRIGGELSSHSFWSQRHFPSRPLIYPGEGAGQAKLQVKMTSVNAHFDDWDPFLPSPPRPHPASVSKGPLPQGSSASQGTAVPSQRFPWRGDSLHPAPPPHARTQPPLAPV